MKNYGFIRVAAAVPVVKVADTGHNAGEICNLIDKALEKGVSIVVFPELSLTGYTCGDLFFQSTLLKGAEEGVMRIAEFTRGKSAAVVVGAPVPCRGHIYDCAMVIRNGNIKGMVPKVCTSDSRTFSSGTDFAQLSEEISYAGQKCRISPSLLFEAGDATFAVEVGNDRNSIIPQSSYHALQGAHLILNPSADQELVQSDSNRRNRLEHLSKGNICAYIHSSAGYGESTQDATYAGAASIWENGELTKENERFSSSSSLIIADVDIESIDNQRHKSKGFQYVTPEGKDGSSISRLYDRISLGKTSDTDFEKSLQRHIEAHPFAPSGDIDSRCREILSIQAAALMKRLDHINCRTAVIGISGGLDSTLALLVTVLAFDRLGWEHDRIVAVTMPGFGTTSRTKNNAWDLMKALGVTSREISIVPACQQHFKDIGHDSSMHDATYENSQARERTQLLMDIANQTGGIVIGTGDLSELALGWATYNGDHMSMYGVNAGIPKTLVQSLVKWAAENIFDNVRNILLDIADTPISPELLPANEKGEIQQVTEDLVGPYELHDFFIYNFVRNSYSPEKIFFLARKAFADKYDVQTIEKWLRTFIRRFFNQQFKRSCMPDGPKIGSVGLSPRGDWSMPSDAWSTTFQDNI